MSRARNPAVRRRLFAEDDSITSTARKDNSNNYLKETLEKEKQIFMQKWNLNLDGDDVKQLNEDGPIEWTHSDGRFCMIGKVRGEKKDMKRKNEETPQIRKELKEAPQLRKRKKGDLDVLEKVRRKISFD